MYEKRSPRHLPSAVLQGTSYYHMPYTTDTGELASIWHVPWSTPLGGIAKSLYLHCCDYLSEMPYETYYLTLKEIK